MEFAHGRSMGCNSNSSSSSSGRVPAIGEEEVEDLRRGPWTVDEDLVLVNYITNHGEGRWNSLARAAGLKRTGKSCRLRWLNYLRPDVRRGNITPEEQLLILQLHFRWGNRWSKIAQHLPGRTDNEIKNYWRTRVQKHAKQLRCDVSSQQFKNVMQHVWMPRLLERIRASAATTAAATIPEIPELPVQFKFSPERSLTGSSSESVVTTQFSSPPVSDLTGLGGGESYCGDVVQANAGFDEFNAMLEFGSEWGGDVIPDNFWGVDDIWSSL